MKLKKPNLQQVSAALLAGSMLASSIFFSKFLESHPSPKVIQSPVAQTAVSDTISTPLRLQTTSFRSSTLKKARQYLIANGFEPQFVDSLFSDPRLSKLNIFPPASKPAKKLTYEEYKRLYGFEELAVKGAKFYHSHKKLLDSLQSSTGVPAFLVVSILGIESTYGKNLGNHLLINVFLTIIEDRPARKDFALQQLEDFLALCQHFGIDPYSVKGSHWGAFLPAQFIPSSLRKYLHVLDCSSFEELYDIENSIRLAFSYLADAGASAKENFSLDSSNYEAAFAYNHSSFYARLAVELAERIKKLSKKMGPL
ncbi:MAG: lytic murein transglycosylase [Candidatus Anstonellaceae archaeon]